MPTLLDRIAELAEPLRAPTFVKAAEFVLSISRPLIIETGCFRGCTGDGQSTVILAMLSKQTGGEFVSFELVEDHIYQARHQIESVMGPGEDKFAAFILGNSIDGLKLLARPVAFAYLDSYDFEEHKAADAQNHQLKEVEILLPKMAEHSAFLIDDCDLPLGGKGGLSIPKILENGYKETATGYQRLLIR